MLLNLSCCGLLSSFATDLTDWILEKKIVEHIFGPNLHVEVGTVVVVDDIDE